MLQYERALQITRAMQPRRKPEMPFEQRPNAPEQVENRFSGGRRHAAEYTFGYSANIRDGPIVLQPITLSNEEPGINAHA